MGKPLSQWEVSLRSILSSFSMFLGACSLFHRTSPKPQRANLYGVNKEMYWGWVIKMCSASAPCRGRCIDGLLDRRCGVYTTIFPFPATEREPALLQASVSFSVEARRGFNYQALPTRLLRVLKGRLASMHAVIMYVSPS